METERHCFFPFFVSSNKSPFVFDVIGVSFHFNRMLVENETAKFWPSSMGALARLLWHYSTVMTASATPSSCFWHFASSQCTSWGLFFLHRASFLERSPTSSTYSQQSNSTIGSSGWFQWGLGLLVLRFSSFPSVPFPILVCFRLNGAVLHFVGYLLLNIFSLNFWDILYEWFLL